MTNKSRVAAQTASIGNQDMMTFMPSPQITTAARAGEGGGEINPSVSSTNNDIRNTDNIKHNNSNNNNNDTRGEGNDISISSNNNSTVSDPIRTVCDRGESMDDEMFNASLDALLKEAVNYNEGCGDPSYNDGRGSSSRHASRLRKFGPTSSTIHFREILQLDLTNQSCK